MHKYLLLGDRSRMAQDFASAAYWYQKVTKDYWAEPDERDRAHYLCAYTLVSEKQSDMVGLGPDLRLRYNDDEQAGIHLNLIAEANFDPHRLGLPVIAGADLMAISLAHADAGIAILMNASFSARLSNAQIAVIAKSESRAMLAVFNSPSILERIDDGFLQDITSSHHFANLAMRPEHSAYRFGVGEPQLAMM